MHELHKTRPINHNCSIAFFRLQESPVCLLSESGTGIPQWHQL